MSSRARFWAARVAVAMYLATAFLLVGAEGSRAVTYTVTTLGDTGEGSLRQAIVDANLSPGADEIRFAVQGAILLQSALPEIRDPVTIDATTQSLYAGQPLIEVRGPVTFDEFQQEQPSVPGLVLVTGSGGSVVRGLSLTRFTIAVLLSADVNRVESSWIGVGINSDAGPNGIGIKVNGAGNTIGRGNVISANDDVGVEINGSDNFVVGNLIGLAPSGTLRLGNFDAGIRLQSGAARNRIGGTVAGDRNVISGNVVNGIGAASATATTVLGNYIGTDITGTVAVGNTTGIRLQNSPSSIGGTAPGSGNVISGNIGGDTGVSVSNSSGTTIEGNFIGTDATGTVALGNDGAGISLESGQDYLVAGNVISGNGSFFQSEGGPVPGIQAFFLSDLTIQGNRIGTTAAGDRALPNSVGIALFDTATVLIGGTVPGQGNVISGNQGPGVELPCFEFGGPGRTTIQGNLIGTNAAGTAAIPNAGGITITCATGTRIGGTVAGAGNVISANNGDGIFTLGTQEVIQGNRIGVASSGAALGNSGSGVYVGSTFPEVGGDTPGAGNIIAFNGGDGVTILAGTGNPIRLNSIHDNVGLGIDLNDDGPSPNDAGDADLGANLTQNFPVLTSAVGSGGVATISGTLDTEAGNYVVDFYGNPTSAGAEGETYLGSVQVTVGTAGPTTFSAPNIPLSQPFVTATATDIARLNTSEFSPAIAAQFPMTITTQASPSVPVGGQIFDTATLGGDVSLAGTVVFRLYGPDDAACAGPPAATFSVPVVADQFVYQSPSFTATSPGTYRFVAEYQEPEVAPVTTACDDPAEAVVVTQAAPTITTQASPGVTVGGSVSDTATVSGGFNPTGTVTFNLYGPDDATCAGSALFTATVPLINFSATSGPFAPTSPGTYRWVASYSGDANNLPVTGVCGDPSETVVVSPAPTTTTSTPTTLPPTTTSTPTTLPPTTTTTSTTTTLPPTTTTTTTTLPPTTTSTSTSTTTTLPTTTTTSTSTTVPPTTTTTTTTTPSTSTSTSTTSTTEPPETTTTSSTTTTLEPTTTTVPPTTTTSSTTTTTTSAPPVPAGTTTTVTSPPAVAPTPTTARP